MYLKPCIFTPDKVIINILHIEWIQNLKVWSLNIYFFYLIIQNLELIIWVQFIVLHFGHFLTCITWRKTYLDFVCRWIEGINYEDRPAFMLNEIVGVEIHLHGNIYIFLSPERNSPLMKFLLFCLLWQWCMGHVYLSLLFLLDSLSFILNLFSFCSSRDTIVLTMRLFILKVYIFP